MHRRITSSIVALEIYAALLAFVHFYTGLHTDEAKYLLNIAYPHPPALRYLLSLTRAMPLQELLIRFVFASALVQCAWIIWDMASVLQREKKVALVMAWLFSAPLLLQGGTIMMVVPTAIYGLLFVWLAVDQRAWKKSSASLFTLVWLFALFTAYQSILFAPLVFSLLVTMCSSQKKALFLFLLPVLLLALYTFTNPMVLASVVTLSHHDAPMPFVSRIATIGTVLMLSGGLLTGLGLWGVVVARRMDFLMTAVLLLAFITLSAQEYYAILLLPILVAGLFMLFCRRRASLGIFVLGHLISTAVLLILHFPAFSIPLSRTTIPFVMAQGIHQTILIDGPFGHDWQYESPLPIGRFSQNLSLRAEDEAGAIVCTKKTCTDDIDHEKWVQVDGAPIEVWVKR